MSKIEFKSIKLENFKNHKWLKIVFDDITTAEGRNGAGKSSIGDAITWDLFGTDAMGNKLEPNPIGTSLETSVELLLQVDGTQILLGRSQKKTAKYFINEVPKKATEFNDLVASLFDKNLFLSLFNPNYFSSQKWQDQRSQFLSYVKEPLNKEVLAVLRELDRGYLEENLKKYSLDDLESLHVERFKKHDKAYERAAERVLTLEEQLKKNDINSLDLEAFQKEIEKLKAQRQAIDEDNNIRNKSNMERSRISAQIESLAEQIRRQQDAVMQIKNEQIEEHCNACGQSLDDISIQKVKDNRQARYSAAIQTGKDMVKKHNELKEMLSAIPAPVEIDRSELFALDEKIMLFQSKLNAANQIKLLEEEIEEAQQAKEKIRTERNESQSIKDAIKEFRTKRSELMVKKVDNLFTNISVKLYEQLKNGEERATFEIEMDGKPYSKLSTAEKIKAGLELIEVLSTQSGVISPCFVDNAESILHFTKPTGQLIVARVVDVDFNIKTQSLKGEKQ
ncbi:AAA family ATPase [Bacillus sp. 1P02SD]|uniref:AAA family ATPase n=1 Tax=Bacillus sp. 1P02SD TaxID=3132264 RepID=UPI0039A36B9E